MRVVAFNGSPRPKGNTSLLIGRVFDELQAEGIETELVQVGGQPIHGCRACYACFKNANGHCVFDDDILNQCVDKMREADGIILGSPTYAFATVVWINAWRWFPFLTLLILPFASLQTTFQINF